MRRLALALVALIIVAISVLMLTMDADKQPSRDEARQAARVEHKRDRALSEQTAREQQANPKVVLRVVVEQAPTGGAAGVDGDSEQTSSATDGLAEAVRPAGVVVQWVPQGTTDVRTMLAAVEAKQADAFVADGAAVASALGVKTDCTAQDLAATYAQLHAAAAKRQLVLHRFSSIEATEPSALPSVLVTTSEADTRLPRMGAALALADETTLLAAESDSGLYNAGLAVMGQEHEGQVAPTLAKAVKARDVVAVQAALDARVRTLATQTQAADALAAALAAAERDDSAQALALLATVPTQTMTDKGRAALTRATRAFSRRGPDARNRALDALMALSDAAEARRESDAAQGQEAARAVAFADARAGMTKAGPLVCPAPVE